MLSKKFYFNDPEGEGPSRETSHPDFVKIITEEFYYDCTDEFSPFGNDDGSDTLMSLEDWYRENGNLKKPLKFLKELIEENWGFETKYMKLVGKEKILKVQEEEEAMFDVVDRAVIATAFGQYKIEGTIGQELKDLADIAIDRQKIITQHQIDNNEIQLRKLLKTVDGKTTSIGEDGSMNELLKTYLQRLDKMKTDLQLLK